MSEVTNKKIVTAAKAFSDDNAKRIAFAEGAIWMNEEVKDTAFRALGIARNFKDQQFKLLERIRHWRELHTGISEKYSALRSDYERRVARRANG